MHFIIKKPQEQSTKCNPQTHSSLVVSLSCGVAKASVETECSSITCLNVWGIVPVYHRFYRKVLKLTPVSTVKTILLSKYHLSVGIQH